MFASKVHKEKIIIVAEHHRDSLISIVSGLEEQGFLNICPVNNGEQIYELLRPYHDKTDKIGLIIINQNLPNCRLTDMCRSLSCSGDANSIPFIILGELNSNKLDNLIQEDKAKYLTCLIYKIEFPGNLQEILLATKFLLALKQERLLRHLQEERLINELATKNIIDAKLKYLVAHDELTGLFNRNTFDRQLRLKINSSNKVQKDGALLFIDVDRFSLINELEGFETGDKLLVELVILIRKLIPKHTLFARIGADEMCLFLENKSTKLAKALAENIKKTIENYRFFSGEVCFSASVSIGIVGFGDNQPMTHPGEMILHARQACHFAKVNGRDKVWVFNNNDQEVKEHKRDIYWVPIIRQALRENQLFLVFQPVVQLSNGAISHYEVLVRLKGENQEIITPDTFIPAAERMGLIHAIDLWVVENAIDYLANLPPYFSYISLSINLSSSAFQYPDLFQTIHDKLESTWVDGHRLTFEITETAAVDNFEKARTMIHKIQTLGCKFALDDFGAGFCSFNYLKTFPVEYLKIDGQFIRNLLNDETDQILVKSMVDIAAKLGKKTIAEFIETPSTALKLKEMGVNFGQGYAFGKPERHLLENQRVPLAILLSTQPHTVLQNLSPTKQ